MWRYINGESGPQETIKEDLKCGTKRNLLFNSAPFTEVLRPEN